MSLILVKSKKDYNDPRHNVITCNPILLPSSDKAPIVKKCWDLLKHYMPTIHRFFYIECTNQRWKIQNVKLDPKKGEQGIIYTKIGLSGEVIDATTKTITYHVIHFYHLTRTAFYKKMIRNNDPLEEESVLLKTIKHEMFSRLSVDFFNQFQRIFNQEIDLYCQDSVLQAVLKRK